MKKMLHNILERIFNVFVLRKLEERFNRLDANILDLKSLQMRESGREFSIDTQHEFAFNSRDFTIQRVQKMILQGLPPLSAV